jgi:hypothetical protein
MRCSHEPPCSIWRRSFGALDVSGAGHSLTDLGYSSVVSSVCPQADEPAGGAEANNETGKASIQGVEP